MGLLYTNRFDKNSKKIWLKHWIRVCTLIGVTVLLVWYGRIYEPKPSLARINDFAVWIIPNKNGLSALAVLPNDGNDSNNVKTGLRIWISPPDSLLLFEQNSSLRYRGKNIMVVGDSLSDKLMEDMLSTLDTNGNFYWLGPLSKELMGEDVFAELTFFDGKPQDYIFDLIYEGHKLRFYGSQLALDSATAEPVSIAILMFKPEKETVYFSHADLNHPEAMALISYSKTLGMGIRRMHLKGWKPEF